MLQVPKRRRVATIFFCLLRSHDLYDVIPSHPLDRFLFSNSLSLFARPFGTKCFFLSNYQDPPPSPFPFRAESVLLLRSSIFPTTPFSFMCSLPPRRFDRWRPVYFVPVDREDLVRELRKSFLSYVDPSNFAVPASMHRPDSGTFLFSPLLLSSCFRINDYLTTIPNLRVSDPQCPVGPPPPPLVILISLRRSPFFSFSAFTLPVSLHWLFLFSFPTYLPNFCSGRFLG